MHRFTYYLFQVAAYATAGPSDLLEQYDNIEETTIERHDIVEEATSIGTDWIAIAVLSIVACCVLYQLQFYEPETEHFQQHAPPLARATLSIVRRLGSDIARFILNILAITVELLLAVKNICIAIFWLIGTGFKLLIVALTPFATRVWRYYDSAKHSHYANLARQRWRSARAFFVSVLPWAIAVGAVFMFFVVPSMDSSISLDDYDIRSYVVPVWVIKARPENRHYVGSSSHYRPDIDVRGVGEDSIYTHLLTDRDIGPTEIVHELEVLQPTTITRTLIFAATQESGTRSETISETVSAGA